MNELQHNFVSACRVDQTLPDLIINLFISSGNLWLRGSLTAKYIIVLLGLQCLQQNPYRSCSQKKVRLTTGDHSVKPFLSPNCRAIIWKFVLCEIRLTSIYPFSAIEHMKVYVSEAPRHGLICPFTSSTSVDYSFIQKKSG